MNAGRNRSHVPFAARTLALMLSGLLILPAAVAAQDATPSPSAALDNVLQNGVAEGLPGVALLVAQDGETVYSAAAGVASVEARVPLAPSDRFRIYSITKTFTATVVLQLVDEGVLSLDDTIGDWLYAPAVSRIPNIDQITVRQLLTHTSGIYDFADDDDSPFWADAFLSPGADWTRIWTLPEILAYADGANHAPYFAPGEGYHYANTGYLLLGMIVEKATGHPFGDELRTRILEPLALHDTFLAEGGAMPIGTVQGYQLLDGQLLNVSASNLSWIWTAGGMVSTTADLARFAQATFAGELLSPASFHEMFTFIPTANPRKGQGTGIYRIETPHGELIGMDGSGPGFDASMMRLPAADITVVVLANMAPGGALTEGIRDDAIAVMLAAVSATPIASD